SALSQGAVGPCRTRPARSTARPAAHARPQAAGGCACRSGGGCTWQRRGARRPALGAGGSARGDPRAGTGGARGDDCEKTGVADRGAGMSGAQFDGAAQPVISIVALQYVYCSGSTTVPVIAPAK